MRTLLLSNSTVYLTRKLSSSICLFHFPSLSRETKKLLYIPSRKCLQNINILKFSSFKTSSTSEPAIYGGWDELRPIGESVQSGESTQLRNFLVSIGIDDRKHVFMFLFGFVCALAISRVRVKSIVVFPAFVLVFAIGLSFGFARSGTFSELSVSKRRSREEIFRVYSDKLRDVVEFFDGIEVKLSNLKNHIQKGIALNKITADDLKNYANVTESLRLSCLDARNIVESAIDGMRNSNGVLDENQKSSRKRKELGDDGFRSLPFFQWLFGEGLVTSKSNKLKDNNKHGKEASLANNQTHGNYATPAVEERSLNLIENNRENENFDSFQGPSNGRSFNWGRDRRIKMALENEKINEGEIHASVKRYIDRKEYSSQHKELQFMSNSTVHLRMDQNNPNEKRVSCDSSDFNVSLSHMEKEAAFVQEQILKESSRSYSSSLGQDNGENETYTSRFRETINFKDNSDLDDHNSTHENEDGLSSSMVSDDVAFDRCLAEANDLLSQAKECIRAKHDEEHAEIMLYKSAKLLSKAIIMKPKSLLAVGQLGNTYLLHGELKLKISRELRALLCRRDPLPSERQGKTLKGVDDKLASKGRLASVLVNVCEECEELLVEAGRKYRLALSIDGNDVRALYNWGLALSFRAQLIADIGPEAAFDADKIFLAAIDKFDTMMSRGNVYAPEALFRWGMALQQRSRLRPITSKERVKLLQQAQRLYEDALQEDSNNFQVKEALSYCISEINFRRL
ncbi:hypothetical protein HS088_TW21G00817 [Tripterygium wilfordii]|uniref:Tetratricopeptide repeat-like superfamily protein n=1 Tax=Tripterygium wilfordii TaxID=458696 RepID=A0A7J7C3I4_TRIWF|nr:uncharacterized protein LOC119988081 isoform X2 [Tripterygium wilfordii]KAF5728668.1 hypothetical protein HS088_TW21G00817 [Tripterygium wilfordii]